MNFDKIYNECKNIVVSKMLQLRISGDAEEYLDEAYCYLKENNQEITKQSLQYRSIKILLNSIGKRKYPGDEFLKETTRICSKCKKDFPVGFFGITVSNNHDGVRLIQPYCRDCAKQYFKEYVDKDRHKWNEYLRNKYKENAAKLSDAYIKKILRCYGWKTANITSQVINYKRREIELKRGLK